MIFSFIFPGQGSQEPGMGKYLFEQFPIAKQTFEEASDYLRIDMKKLCFEGPTEALALTENTQPAILTTSVALMQTLEKELSLRPQVVAGHSIGEYSALVANKVLSFADAVKAVRLRGQAMQAAVPLGQGGMAAVIGKTDDEVRELCKLAESESGHKPLSAANYNCPGQVVISGNKKAIEWLASVAKEKKVKIIPLNVSAPFHCQMMKPAEDVMLSFLNSIEFKKAIAPVIQNTTAEAETDSNQIKKNLIEQICASVRWTESMQHLKQNFSSNVIECGHGKVLTGLMKKIDSEVKVYGASSLEDFKGLESLLKSTQS